MNLITYILYVFFTSSVIIWVGKTCSAKGEVFILQALNDASLTARVNRSLLIGYYLVNLGYVLISIQTWPGLNSLEEVLLELSQRTGLLIFLLGGLHYFNIYFITVHLKKISNP
ncbi:MAG: hypothetical protein CMF34_13625 [Leeuwenhoekiella sp.]|uniref:hypothetical protein n=1 Tax=unclassified Leeuwenhoekiella TaxID=2615029 RepID=UPI000C3DE889|nr:MULTISPECIES: hypothetical protein [unclassified Leeuwenhoekiella]MAS21272.1 hypothetical protein [Leeuwenhoekiella sp.]MAW93912.1 hypothetical protein [Leeuwenhoekiella sp.]MBA81674.1 hypothetical protein [Leeuwenhoekiella sp.]|tara:strand:+ start:27796 stop:28137 length:342 start_codon:yes stop_codon:yes gene_type:complete